MLCVCVVDVMDVVFSVCIVRRGAVGARVWEVCVFRHVDVVSCVHPVAVLNAAVCITCSLIIMSFGSKVRPRTFGCVARGGALLGFLGPDCSYILQGPA